MLGGRPCVSQTTSVSILTLTSKPTHKTRDFSGKINRGGILPGQGGAVSSGEDKEVSIRNAPTRPRPRDLGRREKPTGPP